jgi:hypothetical protein
LSFVLYVYGRNVNSTETTFFYKYALTIQKYEIHLVDEPPQSVIFAWFHNIVIANKDPPSPPTVPEEGNV